MNLDDYKEVIDTLEMKTSDGGTVRIELQDLGRIDVIPWTSYEPGDYCATYEDRVIFSPANGHDVMLLKLLAEHAAERYAAIMAEADTTLAIANAEDSPDRKPPAVVKIDGQDVGVKEFALR